MAEVSRSPEDVIHAIEEFGRLQAGWNSYRAPAISTTAINMAIDVVHATARRGAPMPSAAPTPQGGIALTWYLPRMEVQLLVDDESLDYSVAQPGTPKVIDHGGIATPRDVERQLIERYLLTA